MNNEDIEEFFDLVVEAIQNSEWQHSDPVTHCLVEAASYGLLGFLVQKSKQVKTEVGPDAFRTTLDEA